MVANHFTNFVLLGTSGATPTPTLTPTSTPTPSDMVNSTISYTYDPLYRLTGASHTGAYTDTFAYSYQAVTAPA